MRQVLAREVAGLVQEAEWRTKEAQWEAREQKTFKEAENKILGLFKQGYSLEEVERLLAEEAGTQPGGGQ